ncbi:MAG: hypothetical protein RLZZ165_2033 [Bacteroidota bacterium]
MQGLVNRMLLGIMALLTGVTSLGIAVSAHACSETGFSETRLKPIGMCCKQGGDRGFQSEPCCKLTIRHIKLPAVRAAMAVVDAPPCQCSLVLPVPLAESRLIAGMERFARKGHDPPERRTLETGRTILIHFCSFLI